MERLENYLLETEKKCIGSHPLRMSGSVRMQSATMIWEGGFRLKVADTERPFSWSIRSCCQRMQTSIANAIQYVKLKFPFLGIADTIRPTDISSEKVLTEHFY